MGLQARERGMKEILLLSSQKGLLTPGFWASSLQDCGNALPLFKPPSPWYLVLVTFGNECSWRRLLWGGHQTSAGSTPATTLAGATFNADACSLSGGAWSWSSGHRFCHHEGESLREQKPQRESIAERCGERNWALGRCLGTWIQPRLKLSLLLDYINQQIHFELKPVWVKFSSTCNRVLTYTD